MRKEKPILLAFVGKSASGKDRFARITVDHFNKLNIPTDYLISYTTRPPRENEVNGVDYYFVDTSEFLNEKRKGNILEHTTFRGWYYGHAKYEGNAYYVIGIFDAEGIKEILKNNKNDFQDICVYYMKSNLFTRLRRSYQRQGKWHFEYFRRIFADAKNFIGLKKYLTSAAKWCKIIRNNNKNDREILNEITGMCIKITYARNNMRICQEPFHIYKN